MTYTNSNPELTFSKKVLVLWIKSGRGDSGQVIDPNFMTPDTFMAKEHEEMNHIIASISNQIETTPA